MHHHHQEQRERRFVMALILTSLIFLAEAGGGVWTGSLALLADAGHVFMDAFALGLSYLALRLARRPPDERHTYGYHRMQILAALVNGASLLLIAFEIFREAWQRWQAPRPIAAGPMLVIAVIGLVINVLVAQLLHEHDHDDVNTRSAFLHVLGDALASVGVIGAGVLILITGWTWLDPLISAAIGCLILVSSGRLLKATLHILVEGVPEGLSIAQIQAAMAGVPGVKAVHDLHVWTIGPGYVALSAHVLLDDQALSVTNGPMQDLRQVLHDHFGIEHTTIQLECDDCGANVYCPRNAI